MSQPRFQKNINFAGSDFAIVTTDGASGIVLTASSPGVTAVAFTATGTDGQFTLTLATRSSANYAAVANIAGAAQAYVVAALTPAVGSCIFEASDLATPTALDLDATATTIHVIIGPSL